MQVIGNDRVEFASFYLKDVAHVQFTQGKENKGTHAVPMTWEYFTRAFLYMFFPRDLGETKALKFMNLRQGTI